MLQLARVGCARSFARSFAARVKTLTAGGSPFLTLAELKRHVLVLLFLLLQLARVGFARSCARSFAARVKKLTVGGGFGLVSAVVSAEGGTAFGGLDHEQTKDVLRGSARPRYSIREFLRQFTAIHFIVDRDMCRQSSISRLNFKVIGQGAVQ